ncbi:KEOPS complex subunit Pcc1 [Nanoarchaeota archaeon]
MYRAVFEINKNLKEAYQIFKPEEHQGKRASLEIKKTQTKVQLVIKAQDYVALKAMLNSINRLLMIFDQIQNGRKTR